VPEGRRGKNESKIDDIKKTFEILKQVQDDTESCFTLYALRSRYNLLSTHPTY
jgi:hypothetical protein